MDILIAIAVFKLVDRHARGLGRLSPLWASAAVLTLPALFLGCEMLIPPWLKDFRRGSVELRVVLTVALHLWIGTFVVVGAMDVADKMRPDSARLAGRSVVVEPYGVHAVILALLVIAIGFSVAVVVHPSIAAVVFCFGVWSVTQAWKLEHRKRASPLDARESDRPIVLLRPFDNDHPPRSDLFARASPEERFAAAVTRAGGALVALGDPTDGLPELGARRAYAADSSWRDSASLLIREAHAIVMLHGLSEALCWEWEFVRMHVHPSRVFLVQLPGDRRPIPWYYGEYDALQQAGFNVPDVAPSRKSLVRFDNGWNAYEVSVSDGASLARMVVDCVVPPNPNAQTLRRSS